MAKTDVPAVPESDVTPGAGSVPYYWVEGCKPGMPVRILNRSKSFRDLVELEQKGELEEAKKKVRERGPFVATAFIDEQILKESEQKRADLEGNTMTRDFEVACVALYEALEFNPRARLHPLGISASPEELAKHKIEVKGSGNNKTYHRIL